MSVLNKIEQNFLFPVSRLFSLVLVIILAIVLIGGTVYILKSGILTSSNDVKLSDILKSSDTETGTDKELKYPPMVEDAFSKSGQMKVLNGWLSEIKEKDKKQNFLDNLESLLRDAEEKHADKIEVINSYKDMKLDRIKNETGIEGIADAAKTGFIAIFMFMVLLSIMLLVVILLQFSIERNTRK
jgi:hypothetical protein